MVPLAAMLVAEGFSSEPSVNLEKSSFTIGVAMVMVPFTLCAVAPWAIAALAKSSSAVVNKMRKFFLISLRLFKV